MTILKSPGMMFTFIGALMARGGAGIKLTSQKRPVAAGKPNQHFSGGKGNIGAILIDPNASDEWPYVFLTKTGIGTGDTRLSRIKACVYTFEHAVHVDLRKPWVGLKDLFRPIHYSPLSQMKEIYSNTLILTDILSNSMSF
jgi:hypothetical protein